MKSIKGKILSNIIVLSALILTQVSMAFAWFTRDDYLTIRQTIVVGEYLILLNTESDGTEYQGEDIDFLFAYPMTQAEAEDETHGYNNAYLARIENFGNIASYFRFKINYKISIGGVELGEAESSAYADYFRVSVFTKYDEEDDFIPYMETPTAELDDRIADPFKLAQICGDDETQLKNSKLNKAIETFDAGRDIYTDTVFDDLLGVRSESAEGGGNTVVPGDVRYIKFYVWLDEDTVIGSGGAEDGKGFGNEFIELKLEITMQAVQSAGNSDKWDNFGK